jgi:formylglycine-generating enzyme required for sulfatase activity
MRKWIPCFPVMLAVILLTCGCSSSGNGQNDAGQDDGQTEDAQTEDGGDAVDAGLDATDGGDEEMDGGDAPVTTGCPFPLEPLPEHTFQDEFGNDVTLSETHILCAIDYEDVHAQILVKAIPTGLSVIGDYIYEARAAFVCRDDQVEVLEPGTYSYEWLHHGWEKMIVAFDGYKFLFGYRDWCIGYRPCNLSFEIFDVLRASDDTLLADDVPAVCSQVTMEGNPRPLVPQSRVPAEGTEIVFSMGSTSGDPDEAPVHTVTMRPFQIDLREATHADFVLFLNDHGNNCDGQPCVDIDGAGVHIYHEGVWKIEEGYENVPIVQVSWYGAEAYCMWRQWLWLPTEAQWEMAASAAGTLAYPWGNDAPTCTNAWFSDCQENEPGEVCTQPTGNSREGVCDLAGNVAEWLYDWYDAGYYATCMVDCSNPRGPTDPTGLKVIRGGGFSDPASLLRATDRDSADPATTSERVGLRCTGGAGTPHNP